jgi:MFS family permease
LFYLLGLGTFMKGRKGMKRIPTDEQLDYNSSNIVQHVGDNVGGVVGGVGLNRKTGRGQGQHNIKEKTLNEVIDGIPLGPFHYRLLVLCGLAFMADAMEVSLLSFLSECAGAEWNLSNPEIALITSSVFAGELVGGGVFGPMADIYGRRNTFLIACLIICIGGVASGAAPNLALLVALRATVGFGVGGLTVPFDLLAEFLPSKERGQFLLLIEVFWTMGSLFVAGMAWAMLDRTSWRVLAYITAIPVIISCAISLLFLPESPRWLMEQGRLEEAEQVINEAAKVNGTEVEPFKLVEADYKVQERISRDSINSDINAIHLISTKEGNAHGKGEETRRGTNSNSRSHNSVTNRSSNGSKNANNEQEGEKSDWDITLAIYKQLVGPQYFSSSIPLWTIWFLFGITYYGIILFVTRLYSVHDDDDDNVDDDGASCSFSYQPIFLNASTEVVGLIYAMYAIDRHGRVFSQSTSYALSGIGVMIMASSMPQGFVMAFGMLARASVMAGSCATWVHTPELYGDDCRATAHSVSNVVARVGALISPFIVESDLSIGAVGTILGICSFGIVFATAFLPETAGKDLDCLASGEPLQPNPLMQYISKTLQRFVKLNPGESSSLLYNQKHKVSTNSSS